MYATITQFISDGKPEAAIAEISSIDLNDPQCEQKIGIYHRVYSRHAKEITVEINEAFAKLSQSEQPEDNKPQADQPTAKVMNLSCPWLDGPIWTDIFNPRTGKEYILSDYYQDADGKRHFTHEQAIEIGNNTPGWQLCTDEFHKALADAVWDNDEREWKENVCNTLLDGFEYLTKVLKFELGGYRGSGEGAMWRVGNSGYSWSSAVSGTLAMYLGFGSSWLLPGSAGRRGYGFQVRCLQEAPAGAIESSPDLSASKGFGHLEVKCFSRTAYTGVRVSGGNKKPPAITEGGQPGHGPINHH